MVSRKREKENMNYDFGVQKAPSKRMGSGSYANLPEKPIFKTFARKNDFRSGLINEPDTGIFEVSGIEENRDE